MKTSVIIAAAGMGKRMRSKKAKQFIELKGRPILSYTVEAFARCGCIDRIVIVTGSGDIEYVKNHIADKYGGGKVSAVVPGGSERQLSVQRGLDSVDEDTDIVLIHDGVRPFIDAKYIARLIDAADKYGSCVLGVPVKDTIKICGDNNIITATPDRSALWAAQTPQCFKADIIREAYRKAAADGFLGTDDSMLAERTGVKTVMVEGSYDNIKLTTPEDILLGERILEKRGIY